MGFAHAKLDMYVKTMLHTLLKERPKGSVSGPYQALLGCRPVAHLCFAMPGHTAALLSILGTPASAACTRTFFNAVPKTWNIWSLGSESYLLSRTRVSHRVCFPPMPARERNMCWRGCSICSRPISFGREPQNLRIQRRSPHEPMEKGSRTRVGDACSAVAYTLAGCATDQHAAELVNPSG